MRSMKVLFVLHLFNDDALDYVQDQNLIPFALLMMYYIRSVFVYITVAKRNHICSTTMSISVVANILLIFHNFNWTLLAHHTMFGYNYCFLKTCLSDT